jgi:hypothetical protein
MLRVISKTAMALVSALMIGGCVAQIDEEYADNPVDGEVGFSQEEAKLACHRWDTIYPQTREHERWIIDRALSWVDANVMYSQVQFTNGWRQDCSGFVSMSWKLVDTKPGLVTWTMHERSHPIQWHELRSGDALNIPHHHVMLFAGWADKAKTKICAIEEYATGHPAEITVRDFSDVKAIGYKPIRRDAN